MHTAASATVKTRLLQVSVEHQGSACGNLSGMMCQVCEQVRTNCLSVSSPSHLVWMSYHKRCPLAAGGEAALQGGELELSPELRITSVP